MKLEKRHLYWITGIVLIIVVWRAAVVPVEKKLVALDKKIVRREEALREIKTLLKEYSRSKAGGAVGDVAGPTKDFSPLAFLEKLSKQVGIKPELTYPAPRKLSDKHSGTSIAVELNGIDMGQLLRYLYKVENSPGPLHIRNLHLVAGKDGLLKANFEVSTFVPAR